MDAQTEDALLRAAAFQHVRRLQEVHDRLSAEHLHAGFTYQGERIPLINRQRGIVPLNWLQRFAARVRELDPRMSAPDADGLAKLYHQYGRYMTTEPGRVATEWFVEQGRRR